LGGNRKKKYLSLRISFIKIAVCIFSRLKLQDNLHNLLRSKFRPFCRNFSMKKFHETFALLDKSVYHIFGEDCARWLPQTDFSP
jgi:hypothetical protein